jgi:2-polyprenyl-3-methyl-5-hydroxy-6-metoxy-1,4-benzoquinol methylase
MRIHEEEIPEITRYIGMYSEARLEDHVSPIESALDNIAPFKPITRDLEILEIGVGMGWFLIYCKQKGLRCRGIEISPQLIASAREIGARYDADLDIELGNVEDHDLGTEKYDIIMAFSVFEHVEDWQRGIRKVYDALKPGGVFYFGSTNKFSFTSGEYNFPLYGWLPNRWRYGLRKWRQGEQIMKLGIDFNQFTHGGLRRYFRDVGFSKVMDVVDVKDVAQIRSGSAVKKHVLLAAKRSRAFKHLLLTFAPGTTFICVK